MASFVFLGMKAKLQRQNTLKDLYIILSFYDSLDKAVLKKQDSLSRLCPKIF
jgi:hypothetical protein